LAERTGFYPLVSKKEKPRPDRYRERGN